jgi:hypothetical protein
MWRFRGSPHYIEQQGARLGVSKTLVDRARHNSEIYRVSVLAGQLCERYHRAPKTNECAVVLPAELAQIRGTLGQCEQELEKLHVLAAAAQAIIEDAHLAFGLDAPSRGFRVRCDMDDLPNPADLVPGTQHPTPILNGKEEFAHEPASDPSSHAKSRHVKAR